VIYTAFWGPIPPTKSSAFLRRLAYPLGMVCLDSTIPLVWLCAGLWTAV